jgi:hypothetical protein
MNTASDAKGALIMPHSRFSKEEIVRRGEEIYSEQLRDMLETEENVGKVVVIDVETGEYEIDEEPMPASRRIRARRPEAPTYAIRIGYDTVWGFGGGPERVKR